MTGFKVGDKGQRYEVRYKDAEGLVRTLGWAETETGVAKFFRVIELHPAFHSPEVIDRQGVKEQDHENNSS